MSEEQNKNVVLLLFQPSIIIRGMEKKLVELGYNVKTLVGNLEEAADCLAEAGLFIMNLPDDIMEDPSKQRKLEMLDQLVVGSKKPFILVGEQDLQKDLAVILPAVAKNPWLFRPIDLDSLGTNLGSVLARFAYEQGAKKRLLIVDDDPSYATMVREWTKENYKVDIVTGGSQALDFLKGLPDPKAINLILLDYDMPGMDGPQVLKELQGDPATVSIPVVFLTGIGTKESVARVMELKPRGYILKSTPRENLLESIKNVLDKM